MCEKFKKFIKQYIVYVFYIIIIAHGIEIFNTIFCIFMEVLLEVLTMSNGNGIFRKRKHSYSIISNDVIDNPNLSPQAYYIYSKICRYIDMENFTLTKAFVFLKSNMSQNTFDKYWKELLNEGYLKIYQMPDAENKGKWVTEYELMETAVLDTPYYTMYKINGVASKTLYPKPKTNKDVKEKDYKKSYGNVKEKAKKAREEANAYVPPNFDGAEKKQSGKLEAQINTDKVNTNKVNTNKSSSSNTEEDDYKNLSAKCLSRGLKLSTKQITRLMNLYDKMKVLRAIESTLEAIEDGTEIDRAYGYVKASIENNMKQNVTNVTINKESKNKFNNYAQI